jgi:hypothetical protein
MSRGAAVTVCKSFSSPALDRPQPATATYHIGCRADSVPPEAFGTVRSGRLMSKMPFARAGRLSMAAPPGMPETPDG